MIPHGRREDTWFRDWAQTHAPAWVEAHRSPGARLEDPDRVWRTFPAPTPSTDGYRVIWVHSSPKAARDSAARAARIEAGLAAIETVQARLSSPKTRLKTLVAAEAAAATALDQAGATRWITYTLTQTTEQVYRQERRGRPGSQTRYRRTEKPIFTITATVRADTIAYDAVTDGCFPLITNDTTMTPAQVLAAYRYQPHLNAATTSSKDPNRSPPCSWRTPTASRHSCSATSWPYSPRRSSNARSAPRCTTSRSPGSRSTPNSATAPPPAPNASCRSSATSTATTSSTATRSYRPSNPN